MTAAGWLAEYRAERERHMHAGRISGTGGRIATFCSCGLAFFGVSVAVADNRQRAHSCDVRGVPMTSRNVEAGG